MYEIKLSPYAKIFYTEWLLDPSGSRYNLSIDQTLYGNLDAERLRRALKRYVAEHVLLNSHIQEIEREQYWIKNDEIRELEYLDHEVSVSELLDYVRQHFNLHVEPLYRFRLLRIGDGVYRFIVVMHHLIMDGSASLDPGVFEAIANYYNDENYKTKYSTEEQIKLITELGESFSARIEQNRGKHKEFWRKQLLDVENVDLRFLRLSQPRDEREAEDVDNAREGTAEIHGPIHEISFSLTGTELLKLKQLKSKYSITPYAYGQCIFALLLHKFTDQERLAITYPISIKEGLDFIYGAQINTNLIPYQINNSTTLVDLFNQTREFFRLTMRENIKHGYYPITEIIGEGIDKNLLTICFAQTFFREKPFAFAGITKVETHSELASDGVAKNILLFEQDARSEQNQLNYRVRYDSNAIDSELINNFVTTYKRIFFEALEDLLADNDNKPISSYSLLDEQQYHKIVYEFNQTDKDYPRDKTIHQLFEEQVRMTPNKVAVVYEDIKLTYQELNQRANQLAYYLRDNYNIKPDDLVVLCLNRSEYILIVMLAVLKAGGAYVPIDPAYPDERIGYVLEDTKAQVVLTNDGQQNRLREIARQREIIINIFAINSEEMRTKLVKLKDVNPNADVKSTNLMYVIYTSGTTGNPKGVMIEHRSVVNYAMYLITENKLDSKRVGSQYAGIGFDAVVIEVYPILLSGGSLFIAQEKERLDPTRINEFFHKNHITYAFLPTKFAELFFDLKNSSLLNLIVGGEKLEKFISRRYRVINAYGPTEATVQITSFVVDKTYSNIPIGKPINNIKCYVVNNETKLLPIGAIGELLIGGESLARGYLAHPNLTAKKIISNPFQTKEEKLQGKNSWLYKTGDLVRWLPNGNLEYIGRNDSQVKIRGYRIELGEIKGKLLEYQGIKQAIALVKEHENDKYLIAYYVADEKLDSTKIQNYLVKQLPEYMIPRILIYLKQLPMTINGKLDEKALPALKSISAEDYMAPNNEKEQLICEAFSKILRVQKIGINDDFFALGGNSMQAIQLVSILQSNFDAKVADIFKLRTPSQLAENTYFGKDVLRQKLEQIKLNYRNIIKTNNTPDKQLQKKINKYLQNASGLQIDRNLLKPITNVLLTGATGYLGCSLLNQLLKLTSYKVFLLIRAKSQEDAVTRIDKKFQFYFDKSLENLHGTRIFVFNADIEKSDLGLPSQEYKILVNKIDSVIHAAALVKHYGEYNKFYSANVQATINLLEFSKLTKLKDFHYISTSSVLNCGFVPNCEEYIYTEEDSPNNLKPWDNVYVQTKLQGEQQAIRYRNDEVNSNIYRVGNLAFIAENGRAQENVEDNAFFNWLRCLFRISCVAQDLNLVEISPADLTAKAIVKLFDKKQLINAIHHVFNPYLFDLFAIITDNRNSSLEALTMEQFIDNITRNLGNDIYHDVIVKFLLRQGWLDGWGIENTTSIKILQNKTRRILNQLDFDWSPISNKTFDKYLSLLNLYGENEMLSRNKILKYLEVITKLLPTPVYWLDTEQKYLGVNELVLRGTGTKSYDENFAGKTPYDVYPKEMAEDIVQHHKEVIRTGKTLTVEESIRDVTTGEIKHFNATIAPLCDDNGKIIGTIGTSIDITTEKKEAEQLKKTKVLEHLDRIAQTLPTPVYWLDINQQYLGINELVVKASGTRSFDEDFANKTPYDLYPKEMAEDIVQHHKQVIRTGKTLAVEESIRDVTTGELKYFNATIAPLYDDNGVIIGTIGTSIDITAEKNEAERLKKARVFEHLEKIAQLVPEPFYWLDKEQKYLGVNQALVEKSGTQSYKKNFAGKTPYDLFPQEMAENIVQHHKEVIRTKKTLAAEETAKNLATGENKYVHATIAPLVDDDDQILGTVGVSIDMTEEKKEAERLKMVKVFEHLERVAQIVPTPIYWLGLNQEYLGINELVVKASGTTSYEKDFANKTPYDLYPKEMAEEIVQHHKEVIRTGKMLFAEESIKDVTTRKIKYFNAFIAPLRDDHGSIIGTIGTSIDITAEKEADRLRIESERLRAENELQKLKLAEEEKFRRTANQVVHDMHSPLTSLKLIMKACAKDVQEKTRIALREAANGLEDIANDLLSKYHKEDSAGTADAEKEQPQTVMVALTLQQLLTEKNYQYQSLPITFDSDFDPKSNFAFISVEPSAFKRMMSNLINNAVDALEGKKGEIKLKLNVDDEHVQIIVQDSGKGMPKKVLDKIKQNIAVTSDKKEGHGIGFTQISDTLRRNNGEIAIDSKVGKGTKITLSFVKATPPEWAIEEIAFNKGDTVIILDDDNSIHKAWDMRLQPYTSKSDIKVEHFTAGKKAIEFIKSFAPKDKLFLLTDYELLKQELNGINVVEQTKLKRSLLVTSHHANPIVQELALKANIKMLPKQLASEIPIIIVKKKAASDAKVAAKASKDKKVRKVDIVIIENHQILADSLAMELECMDKEVDRYYNARSFLAKVDQYDKDTKICTDYGMPDMNGADLTKKLHEKGFTKLYILTGWDRWSVKEFALPDYVTVLYKSDPNTMKKLAGKMKIDRNDVFYGY